MRAPLRTPRPRLSVRTLEDRVVPAAPLNVVKATVAGTVLTLTGDDAANTLGIHKAANGDVIVTATGGTSINTTGTLSTTITGPINTVRVYLLGGNDTLKNDGALATDKFDFPGGLTVNAGDGNNLLDLRGAAGTQPVTLGSLTYTGADGSDGVLVGGGVSPTGNALGAVTLTLGDGGTNPNGVAISDATLKSFSLTGGDGFEEVDLTSVTGPAGAPAPAVNVNGGLGALDLTVTNSTVGAVTAKANGDVTLGLTQTAGTMAVGAVTVSGSSVHTAQLNLQGTIGTKNVSVTGSTARIQDNGTAKMTVTGSLTATGQGLSAELDLFGPASTLSVTGPATVKSTGDAFVFAAGDNLDVDGVLTVTGGRQAGVSLTSATATDVAGLTVTGGIDSVSVTTSNTFQTAGKVSITGKAGDDTINLGSAAAGIGGLSITTGAGADTVNISGAHVIGPATIFTGAGADVLNIQAGSTFDKTLGIDQGSGDDRLNVTTNGATAVTFGGKVTVQQGAGNDRLVLDQTLSKPAVFAVAGNLFDGGGSLNDDNGGNTDNGVAGNLTFKNYEV